MAVAEKSVEVGDGRLCLEIDFRAGGKREACDAGVDLGEEAGQRLGREAQHGRGKCDAGNSDVIGEQFDGARGELCRVHFDGGAQIGAEIPGNQSDRGNGEGFSRHPQERGEWPVNAEWQPGGEPDGPELEGGRGFNGSAGVEHEVADGHAGVSGGDRDGESRLFKAGKLRSKREQAAGDCGVVFVEEIRNRERLDGGISGLRDGQGAAGGHAQVGEFEVQLGKRDEFIRRDDRGVEIADEFLGAAGR